MQRQREEMVPIGESLLLPRRASEESPPTLAPGAAPLHPGRPSKPACLGQRSGSRPGFMARMMALALERIGWSDAEHWVRMQGSFELAQARLRETAA